MKGGAPSPKAKWTGIVSPQMLSGLGLLCRVVTTAVVLWGVGSATALGDPAAPGFGISSVAQPTVFQTGDECIFPELGEGCDSYTLRVVNTGNRATEGTIVIRDDLPERLHARAVVARNLERPEAEPGEGFTCSSTPTQCEYGEPMPPGDVITIVVNVEPDVSFGSPRVVTNVATVEGGGAPSEASTSTSNTVNGGPASFGVQDFGLAAYTEAGRVDAQAADHPSSITTSIDFNTTRKPEPGAETFYEPIEHVRDIVVDLPSGLVSDALATPRCPEADLFVKQGTRCPAASRIGTATVNLEGTYHTSINQATGTGGTEETTAIYNMVPERGYPEVFGFAVTSKPLFMYASLARANGEYRGRVATPGVVNAFGVDGVLLTFFGDPARRDGGTTLASPFIRNPTSCEPGPLEAQLEADSWEHPHRWSVKRTVTAQGMIGCESLRFEPSIDISPEATQADQPSGYEIGLTVPQGPDVFPGVATPDIRSATVTLPPGLSLSPAAADGLEGCEATGPQGIDIPRGMPHADEAGEGEVIGADGLSHLAPGHCPASAVLGSVEIVTPLLEEPLKGKVYLADPTCGRENQPSCTEASARNGELFGIYLEAEAEGAIVKLKGTASVDPATGQVTTTFEEDPQLPFSEVRLHLNGGPRAALSNPQVCGAATTTSDISPWSAPETADATPSTSFVVTGCPGVMAFGPSFSAGSVVPVGGGFTPFTLTVSRQDGEQELAGITVHMPPGLLGRISEVPLCDEPQSTDGTCPATSRIGTTNVAAGAGSEPLWLSGSVYLTGPYKGAPYGLSVVVPAKAGPFNLGNEVVRAAISVDPKTSALTVTSDPLPRIKDGIPFRLKTVNVTIDRPNFIFNPTNCSQQQITGSVSGVQPDGSAGSAAAVSTPFALTGCKNLPFKPKFTVLTQAKTSKANGAYLHVKVTSGPGQANIGKVKVDLPKQLPSRLTTLQKACLAAVFEANPATCPAASVVGEGTAVTPVLKNALKGPAYLVSHGGAAFPDLVIVLQGEGITLDLVGNTDIKKGITSSTFKSVPDAPITTFDLVLPEGPHSALAANGNLCKTTKTVTVTKRVSRRVHGRVVHLLKKVKKSVAEPLVMPTTIAGQNGAVLQQTTKVAVTGCAKAKARKAGKHKKGKRKSKSRKR